MRFSRFFTAFVLVAMSCAQQQQNDDDVPDDTPSDGGTNDVAGKANGGTTPKGGSSSTGGKSNTVAGKPATTAGTDGGGDEGGESSGGTGGSSGGTGGASQGGKAAGGAGGKASGGMGGMGGKASGGSAGMSGSGGSSSGTGGGGGSAGSGCKASPGGPVAGLSARYESEIDNATGTSVGSQLSIYNTSANTFNLTDLRVRYYLTNEVSATINKTINWAWLRPIAGGQTDIKPQVIFNVVDMTCAAAKADTYFEFTFGATAGLLQPNHYVLFSWSANNAMTQSFDQSNDYSFNAAQVIASDFANVVVLQNNGNKIWGTEP